MNKELIVIDVQKFFRDKSTMSASNKHTSEFSLGA
ncbi:MAG: hypothetical protein ACD_50C00231G0008 [uncultured bacterium]|nr:MAG: hypothetical protein ACD_50C00231G0008 [uncultured bacterium]